MSWAGEERVSDASNAKGWSAVRCRRDASDARERSGASESAYAEGWIAVRCRRDASDADG